MSESKIGGRYILGEQIGRGGMATVYHAHDPQFGRDVAIKMLHSLPGDELEEFLVKKFRQEAKIIASLEHYAIVPVYDFGRHDDWPYLVMRLMDGGTLKDSIQQGALPLVEIQIVLDRICSALERAHQSNIVHRDIKPTNIFIDGEGLVYLGDFGIARVTAGDQTTSYLGSPRYMAPEQAQGDPLSPATDIYQMGIVLFEMLTGRKPFSGETPEQTILMHLQDPIPRPTMYDADLPIGMDSVIELSLAKHPEDRFQTAGDLAAAFRHALKSPPAHTIADQDSAEYFVNSEYDLPVESPEAEEPYVTEKRPFFLDDDHAIPSEPASEGFLAQNRWLLWLVASVLTLLLICGGSYFAARAAGLVGTGSAQNNPVILPPPSLESQAGNSDPISEPVAETEAEIDEETESNPVATVTLPVFEELDIDSSQLAELGGGAGGLVYAAESDQDFSIFKADDQGVAWISDNSFRAFGATFSPDGRRVAWHEEHEIEKTWEVYSANADGSDKQNITNNRADDSFPRWSPDGSQIVFHTNRNLTEVDQERQFDIYVIDVQTGNELQLTDSEQNEFGGAFSPAGDQIVFHRQLSGNIWELFIINADGTDEEQITTLNRPSLFASWSPDGNQLVFHGFVNGFWQIFTLDLATRNTTQVTFDAQNSFYPKWSPNGEWIAFHREFDAENRDIYLVSADGTSQVRVTNTPEQERMPDWQPAQR